MVTRINLSGPEKDPLKSYSSKESRLVSSSFFVSIVILVLTFLVLAGVLYYTSSLEKNIAGLMAKIQTETQQINADDATRVADFQQRMDLISSHLTIGMEEPATLLSEIEQAMVPGVVLLSFHQETDRDGQRRVLLDAQADSIAAIAQQVLQLKQSKKFSGVIVEEAGQNSDGKETLHTNMII